MKKKIFLFLLFFLFCFSSVKAIPDNAVARINETYYTSISSAINAATDNTKTTIVLVKNRAENITIKNTKNIVLDLNGYTLSNSGEKATVISNNGILELTNGTVTSNAGSGMINNNKDATLTINSGSYIATGTRQVLYNNGGTAIIKGNASIESDTSERASVHNLNNGTTNVINGTIIANNSYAVYNEKGTLNIGTLDDEYNKTTPIIQGKTYGVIANNTYNIYDGIIKGSTYHVGISTTGTTPTVEDDINETKVNDIEEYSEKVLSSEEIDDVTYKTFTYDLDISKIVKITFNPNGGDVNPASKKIIIGNTIGDLPIPTKIDNSFDGWFTMATGGEEVTSSAMPDANVTYHAHWTYVDPNTVAYVEGIGLMSLIDAFETGGNIRLEKDVILPSSVIINKELTLDLNGHTISLGNKKIGIKERVTITDSSDDQTGKITSNSTYTIVVGENEVETNGYLIHKGGTIEGLGEHGAIYNYETVEIDGGTVQGSATGDKGFVIYNRKNLIMKSGTVYSENGRAVQVFENSVFTMDGGLLKSDATNDQTLNLYGNCQATINGGTIEGLNDGTAGIAMFGNTDLTVNGGTIKGSDMAIAGNGREDAANANITINGGDIIATNGVGIYLPQRNSTTIINGGNISGPTGIEIRAGNLIVNDGYIEGTSDTFEITHNLNGTTSKGSAIAVVQHISKQPIEVIINGGNLKAETPISEGNPLNNPQESIDQITITIVDGNFESTGTDAIYSEDPETIINQVSGGTYTYDPTDYVNDDYGVIVLPDDTYKVVKLYKVIISDNEYVSSDKEKYSYKSIVKISIDKKVVNRGIELYDINGNKLDIEINNNEFIMPEMDIIVKIKYDKIMNPDTGDKIYKYMIIFGISIIGIALFFIIKKVKGKRL